MGFEKLGEATGTQPKSLIRMFGPRGNPQARNLFSVLGYLQKRAGLHFHVYGRTGVRPRSFACRARQPRQRKWLCRLTTGVWPGRLRLKAPSARIRVQRRIRWGSQPTL